MIEFDALTPHGFIVLGLGGPEYACVVRRHTGEYELAFLNHRKVGDRLVAQALDGPAAFRVDEIRAALDSGGNLLPVAGFEVKCAEDVLLTSAADKTNEQVWRMCEDMADDGVIIDYGDALWAVAWLRGATFRASADEIVEAFGDITIGEARREHFFALRDMMFRRVMEAAKRKKAEALS